jgi:hypothetical protein
MSMGEPSVRSSFNVKATPPLTLTVPLPTRTLAMVAAQAETSWVTGETSTSRRWAIKIGDVLLGGERVTATRKVQRTGTYAPFTTSGTIMVNGVPASSYVTFQGTPDLRIGPHGTGLSYQWLAHAFQAPHRVWCTMVTSCERESYTTEGISTWVHFPHKMGIWLVNQEWWVMLLLMVPIVHVLAAF